MSGGWSVTGELSFWWLQGVSRVKRHLDMLNRRLVALNDDLTLLVLPGDDLELIFHDFLLLLHLLNRIFRLLQHFPELSALLLEHYQNFLELTLRVGFLHKTTRWQQKLFYKALAAAAVNIEVLLQMRFKKFRKLNGVSRRLLFANAVGAATPSLRKEFRPRMTDRFGLRTKQASGQRFTNRKCVICGDKNARGRCWCGAAVCISGDCYEAHCENH